MASHDPYRGSQDAAPYTDTAQSAVAAPQSITPAKPVMSPIVPDPAHTARPSEATNAKPRSEEEQTASATPMFVPMSQSQTNAPATASAPTQTPAPTPAAAPVTAPAPAIVAPAPELPVVEQLTNRPEDAAVRYEVATRHLMDAVPQDIAPYFDLFMYVSKANKGPLGQRMFVFQRDADGKIVPYAEWRVSTGREQYEIHHDRKIHTVTPEGMFMLDPKRFYQKYYSRTWDNAPMHYAMFYDMMTNGSRSGIAIHAAIGQSKIDRLGRRDSAGCIRLSPRNAKELFYKVQNTTHGSVPVLALNDRQSTDRWGKAQRDQAGGLVLQDGYRALLYVENFDGNQETVGPVVAYTH